MTEAIEKVKVTSFAIPGKLTATALELPEGLSFKDWKAVIVQLGFIESACLWWWGDAIRFGERKYGEMYSQALEQTDYEKQTLKDAAWVSGKIESSRRRDDLSWPYHKEVAVLEPAQQDEMLELAAKGKDGKKLSIQELRRSVRRLKATFIEQPIPTQLYRVIYADPPWQYGDKLIEGYGAAEHHYPTMSIEELCALKIPDLSAPDSVLFMWATSPLLRDCFQVIEAWGFEYKTSFVWDKVKHNMGHYNSVRHEFLLICTRGTCTPDTPTLVDSVQTIERSQKHSEKPEEFRQLIDLLYPRGNRIELFARSQHDGWDTWGNQ